MEFDDYLASPDALRETSSAQGTLLHPGENFDGFQVIAFLGRGTASEVWRVHDLRQNRDYALKIFAPPPDAPEHVRQRFLTEARALDEFRHPHLMRRYLLQEQGDHLYFTMDVLRPLPEHLAESAIRHLLDDVLAGLDALHAKGLVHRDLKPANILLDDKGRAVVADLGVAHVTDANLAKRLGDTDTPNPTLVHGSPFVGTPHYAAPEQLTGETVTPATDIYALGVILEELFDGRPPLCWRSLIRHLTMSRPSLRPQSVRQVRRLLLRRRLIPALLAVTAAALLAVAAVVVWHLAQPNWRELPDAFGEVHANPSRLVITLDGGHYVQPHFRFNPLLGPARDVTHSTTNIAACKPVGKSAPHMHRWLVFIQGRGTLKCPELTSCEVHLSPGVTFITSGRFRPDGVLITSPVPPPDTCWDDLGYPAYVLEPSAKLVFTDNDAYPPALIRRP